MQESHGAGLSHHRTIVALDIEQSTQRSDPVKADLRAKAYELFDQVVEPFFRHFALPPGTPPRAVVEEAIRAAKTGIDPVETPCLNPEHEAIRQFRASLRNRGFQNGA